MNRFLLLLLLLAGSLRWAQAQRLVTQTATLAAGQRLALDLKFAHTIRVRPGAGVQVQARVTINGNQQNDLYGLTLENSATELRVVEQLEEEQLRQSRYTGNCDGGSFNSRSNGLNGGRGRYNYCVRIDYEVTLPAGTSLQVTTISGDLDVSGLTGPLTASTISGDMQLADLTGALTVRSVSGDLKISGVRTDKLEAKSVSGDVALSWPPALAATLRLHTVSGEVYADPAVAFSNLRPRSSVGYELHGSLGASADSSPQVRLESVSGDVFFKVAK